MGVQGRKRQRFLGADFAGDIDPVADGVRYRRLEDVPLGNYDAALACIPDAPKLQVLRYLLGHGKHVLVEKPLFTPEDADLTELEALARSTGAVCYTAYNHRFEPHFVRMRDLVRSGALGRLYRCRMFYGNGTARLVRDSVWRDEGAGVLPDLGSHLLDTARFWFGELADDVEVASSSCYENRAPDHVVVLSRSNAPHLELEMTLLSWRNHFTCDLFAERGSAHITSLCKWGPTTFTRRTRVVPSGRPPEEQTTLVSDDPTWQAEYDYFKRLCAERAPADLSNDIWLNRTLRRLGRDALARVSP
jgi:predicted dehydrogenase